MQAGLLQVAALKTLSVLIGSARLLESLLVPRDVIATRSQKEDDKEPVSVRTQSKTLQKRNASSMLQ